MDQIERIEAAFKRRYQRKKLLNLAICTVIVALGVSSVVYIWRFDGDGLLTFRWMTVDGTIFTTFISACYLIVGVLELAKYTELTSRAVYFMRLASAVAESLIMTVVLVSQLPFFPEHMHIFRYDMFNMHLLIPVLTVASFIVNDSPVGRLKPAKLLHGTWFITLYACVIVSLIRMQVVPAKKIPYFFLDFDSMSAPQIAGVFAFIYALGFFLSWALYRWNKKLSWLWFRGVTDV